MVHKQVSVVNYSVSIVPCHSIGKNQGTSKELLVLKCDPKIRSLYN